MMRASSYFILATYSAQLIQLWFFPVPSAGSTLEILFKVKKENAFSHYHPAKAALRSLPKIIVLAATTIVVAVFAVIPLITLLLPEVRSYFVPFFQTSPRILDIIAIGVASVNIFRNGTSPFSIVFGSKKVIYPFNENFLCALL